MPSSSKNRSSKSAGHFRDYDKESGKGRVSKRQVQPISESDDISQSESEIESEMEMKVKDDSRRKKTRNKGKPAVRNAPRQPDQHLGNAESDGEELAEEKSKDVSSSVAPHVMVLLAASYHIGLNAIRFPTSSFFRPYAGNWFMMVQCICELIVDNTLLHEVYPEFFSPVIYLYYSHVFYIQILRARKASDTITRIEKRLLTRYETLAPFESWPIASPMIGMVQALGAHKTVDPMYQWIVPALPDLSRFTKDKGLLGLSSVYGSHRFPIPAAIQQFIRNFGAKTTSIVDNFILPVTGPLSTTNQFLGLSTSASTDADFVNLAFNCAWKAPSETGVNMGTNRTSGKQSRIARWNIPEITNSVNFQSMENYLGMPSDEPIDWMKHLLRASAAVNKFFPGSSNLNAISPLTTLDSLAIGTFKRSSTQAFEDGKWYYERLATRIDMKGYTFNDQSAVGMRLATSTMINADLAASFSPSTIADTPGRSGPFFVDDANQGVSKPIFQFEVEGQPDPTLRFAELIESNLYDNEGGKKR